ncbi:lipoprotein signal peptidase [Bacteroidales bacterium]|nr:lipoprotein signal peptidase [Bacteroidales bacterium]
MSQSLKSILIVIAVLIIDQTSKIWIKTHMMLGQEYKIIGDWFIIHFTENDGMAFGWDIPGSWGKLILTLFRIIAVSGIGYYIHQLIKEKVSTGLVISMSLILAGAIGNIVDSVFYGIIFNDSYYQIATMFPEAGGYGKLFYGRVVDLFYFPIINTHYPQWFPFIGGNHLIFFRPVFNVADAAISVGVMIILFFQRSYFSKL